MSTLEIVLYVIIGAATIFYIAAGIYDLKHPEKKEARKKAKLEKKLAKKRGKMTTEEIQEEEDED